MSSCQYSMNVYAVGLAVEFLIRAALFVVFLITEELEPFQRKIQQEELWLYNNPHAKESHVSTRMLFSLVIFVPIIVITIFSLLKKDKNEFLQGLLACSLAELLNGVITNSIKLLIARPRPDFLERCFPDGNILPNLMCTGDPDTVNEGRKSFPSGHSSLSFCGFGFVFLYLAGKLHVFERQGRGIAWRIVLTLFPLYTAMMVALSRTIDYRHHYEDVAVGSLLGFVIAYSVYRQYYPALSHANCDKPYTVIYPKRDLNPPEYSINGDHLGQSLGQLDNIKMV